MKLFNTGTGVVLSYGELLLRICTDEAGGWLEKGIVPVYPGGSELNVAAALALWGARSRYFTALPDYDLSRQIISNLKNRYIDISRVRYLGDRIGLYFLGQDADLKQNSPVYDRGGSSFAALKPGETDWEAVLEGVSWFHFSAICPAISQQAADVCTEVLKIAARKGITISLDLNYRPKLWQYAKQPNEIIPGLMPFCDVVMGNIWAAEAMLGIPVPAGIHNIGSKNAYQVAAYKTSVEIVKQYPKCSVVANTFRFDALNPFTYYATLYTRDKFITSRTYAGKEIADRVGSGDCFMAGLIYGFYKQWPLANILEYAAAAAFLKLGINGDTTNKTSDAIKKAMKHG